MTDRFIRSEKRDNEGTNGDIVAPLNGRIVQINVKEGDEISEGDPVLVIESMKMENKILAAHAAVVKHIEVSAGEQVQTNQILITLAST